MDDIPQAEDQWSALERWAMTRLEHGVTVAAIVAQHLGMERSALTRSYRRERGITPGHYLRDCRIMRACRLLRESSQSLRHIAIYGYRSRAAFHAAFLRGSCTATVAPARAAIMAGGNVVIRTSRWISTCVACDRSKASLAADGTSWAMIYDLVYGRNGHPHCASRSAVSEPGSLAAGGAYPRKRYVVDYIPSQPEPIPSFLLVRVLRASGGATCHSGPGGIISMAASAYALWPQ